MRDRAANEESDSESQQKRGDQLQRDGKYVFPLLFAFLSAVVLLVTQLKGLWDEWYVEFLIVPGFVFGCGIAVFEILRKNRKISLLISIMSGFCVSGVFSIAVMRMYLGNDMLKSHPKSVIYSITIGIAIIVVLALFYAANKLVLYVSGSPQSSPVSPVPLFHPAATQPHLTTQAATTKTAQLPDDLKATLLQLRHSFEQLAIQSKGLYHTLMEWTKVADFQKYQDHNPPGLLMSGPLGDSRTILRMGVPPGDSSWPRELSNDERKNAPAADDTEKKYVRDNAGRAIAVWELATYRTGYTYGDHNVVSQFENIATAAANALYGVPDDVVSRLPEKIRPLFRPRQMIARRYVFGKVPLPHPPFSAQGWMTAMWPFDEGTIVDTIQDGTGTDDVFDKWLLLLHLLGWDAQPGDMLRASCWYWAGNTSISTSFPENFPDPISPQVPRHRFYSIIGSNNDTPSDICYASMWAIDRLLKMMA